MTDDELWYVEIPLRSLKNELHIQTFCNQCGKLILQEISEKYCGNCKSESWLSSTHVGKEYRQMLIKMQKDPDFRLQIKCDYKRLWNEKFPKYKIPEPDRVGKLIQK